MKRKICQLYSLVISLLLLCSLTLIYVARYQIHARIAEVAGVADIAFVGDSIIAGGNVWDWQMGSFGFRTRNFGQGGAPIDIISWITKKWALPVMRPKIIVIMAGSNNAKDGMEGIDRAIREYSELLLFLSESGCKIVVCSTLPRANPALSEFYRTLNENIRQLCEKHPNMVYLDLWPQLSNGRTILPEMTRDGVHLTPKAYKVWGNELRGALAHLPEYQAKTAVSSTK